jgi:hypothetical protein
VAHQLALNGQPVLGGWMSMPRVGVWTAELRLPDAVTLAPGAAVTLTPEAGAALKGTALGAGVFADVTRVRVVGGSGGLQKCPAPLTYRDLSLGALLTDTLGPVGERLAPSSDAAVTGTTVKVYSRIRQPAAATLSFWAGELGFAWRVLPDGTVWVGADTYPAAPKAFAFVTMGREPDAHADVIAPESIEYLAGLSIAGRKVSHVTYQVGASLRAEVLYEWTSP